MTTKIALTIAGSDSGGGAGIQADLKTFARFCVFGTSVITAVTAQNTRGVAAWEAISPRLVRAQIDAVFADLAPQAFKTGMLGNAAVVRSVVEGIRGYRDGPLVVDPVMVASSGAALVDDAAVKEIRDKLIPLAALVTPNLDEAAMLLGLPVSTEDEMCMAAEHLVHDLGAGAALVKGGHGTGLMLADVLYDGAWTVMRHPRLDAIHTHGTGCTLSAGVAAHLALGMPLRDSVNAALGYVQRAIASAPGLGNGHGPLNHFA